MTGLHVRFLLLLPMPAVSSRLLSVVALSLACSRRHLDFVNQASVGANLPVTRSDAAAICLKLVEGGTASPEHTAGTCVHASTGPASQQTWTAAVEAPQSKTSPGSLATAPSWSRTKSLGYSDRVKPLRGLPPALPRSRLPPSKLMDIIDGAWMGAGDEDEDSSVRFLTW